jgi:hypothetical protein
MTAGNLAATIATLAGVLSDLKSGDTMMNGNFGLSGNNFGSVNFNVSTSTYIAVTTTTTGWSTQVVELSILWQSIALGSDLGIIR